MILFSHLLIAATPQFDGRKKCTVKKAKTRGYKVEYINDFFVMGTHFSVTGEVTCFFTLSGGAFPPFPPPCPCVVGGILGHGVSVGTALILMSMHINLIPIKISSTLLSS